VNEELLGQMGLILTQLRYARRAIEDIERSTARYNSFAFATALSAGPRFGEPPLFNGALKVYVINIHDLEPGGGIGSLIQGVLGGLGAFTGNLLGGIPGGFLGGFLAPGMIGNIVSAVGPIETAISAVREIMNRVGQRDTPAAATASQAQAQTGGASMPTLLQVIDSFTALFNAAGGGTGTEMTQSLQSMDARVRPLLTTINEMLEGLMRVINGLILLVPILSGALASLIVRIDDIRVALINALQFVLRNVFLIRGVALVTIYDTLAAIARMGVGLLSTLGTAVERILASAFSIAGSVMSLVIEGLRFIGGALSRTVNALLPWVVNTVDLVLAVVARSPIFALLAHIVRILPSVLPALNQVLNGPSATLRNQSDLDALARAGLPSFATAIPGAAGAPGSPTRFDPMPDLSALALQQPAIDAMTRTVASAAANVAVNLQAGVASARDVLTRAGDEFSRAAGPGELARRAEYQRRLRGVANNATALADSLQRAHDVAAQQQDQHSAMRDIATAYEGWLTGGGLRTLVTELNTALAHQPTAGTAGERGIMGQIVAGAGPRAMIPPRAVIDIDSIEIVLGPPPPQPAPGPPMQDAPHPHGARHALRDQLEHQHDLEERGITLDPGAAYPQVPV